MERRENDIKQDGKENAGMSDVFEMFCEIAGNAHFDAKFLNGREYEDIRQDILHLQEKYKGMDLTEGQRFTIDELIKVNAEMYEEGMTVVYRKGLCDCVSLLKDLGIL